MSSFKNSLNAFTLVELIVVITIVGILSTVGFVSYSGYLTSARDSNRFSQMTKLSDSLQVYGATKSLPLPDDYIEITASGATNVIAYQGYVGTDVLETIDYTNGGKDPKDDSFFTYYLTKDRKSLQLLAFMEEQVAHNSNIQIHPNTQKTYAVDYEDRFPKVYGKKLGVLVSAETTTLNTPVQELSSITSGSGYVDVVNTDDTLKAIISEDEILEGTGSVLVAILPNWNCRRLKQTGKLYKSGVYNSYSFSGEVKIYCRDEEIGKTYFTDTRRDPSYESVIEESSWEYEFVSPNSRTGDKGLEFIGGYYGDSSKGDIFMINPQETYQLSGYFRSQGSVGSRLYFGIYEYDKKERLIQHQHIGVRNNTDTVLAQAMTPTDTSIVINDKNESTCSAWQAGITNSAVAFDTHPSYSDLPNFNIIPNSGYVTGVNDNGNTCTINLANPAETNLNVGTNIRQHFYSSTYNYGAAAGVTVPNSWQRYSMNITGQSLSGGAYAKFRPGTKYIRILIFANYHQGSDAILQADDINFTKL